MRTIPCTFSSFGYSGVPAPAVQAYYYFPRIRKGNWVTFMIDTGASETCLNGLSALPLQKHFKQKHVTPSCGIGGSCDYYQEKAIIVFRDDKGKPLAKSALLGIQKIDLAELANRSEILRLPCLLGRDILSTGELRYNVPQGYTSIIFP